MDGGDTMRRLRARMRLRQERHANYGKDSHVSVQTERFEYTVLLEVRVTGPAADWDRVASALAARIAGLEFPGGFKVREAGIDEAKENE